MYHFFVDSTMIDADTVSITGTDVNHIKNVLRMKVGEKILISDGNSHDFVCHIQEFSENSVILGIENESEERTELDTRFYLFQGLPKSEKMELIIQKAVELGVYKIIPVAMKRSIVKLDEKKQDVKIKRWQAISESAAKQSKRAVIPEVKNVLSFSEAVEYAKSLTDNGDSGVMLMPYENYKGMAETKRVIETIKPGMNVCIFIGPEGGYDNVEVQKALDNNMHTISLGKRILRTETAGLAILSILMFMMEE